MILRYEKDHAKRVSLSEDSIFMTLFVKDYYIEYENNSSHYGLRCLKKNVACITISLLNNIIFVPNIFVK